MVAAPHHLLASHQLWMAGGAAHLDVFVRSWKTPTIVVSSTVLNFGDSHSGLEKRWNN
jgi:hypothetical protein